MKKVGILVTAFLLLVAVIFGGITLTKNLGKSDSQVTQDDASKQLAKLLKKVDVEEKQARKASVDIAEADLADSLPSIDKYTVKVDKSTDLYAEIFATSEKAGDGTDGWLVDMAKQFNASNPVIDGKNASVKIRSISSGEGLDYIASGKYKPDGYTPSNALWGEMLKTKGVAVDTISDKLLGNVAGILVSKAKNDELVKKYGAMNIQTIIEAVKNNELAMGYTNPFQSATGLNFLISTLDTFDSNLLSDEAKAKFEQFQTNIPFVAYTTLQMRSSASSGVLDGFIMEYQTYKNSSDLISDYVFTPFGVRHDNPLYAVGNISAEKKAVLSKFAEFCLTAKSQELATQYGFNNLNDYKAEMQSPKGETIVQAQKLWKDKKNGNQDIVAVFVADRSGSMDGEPLTRLKESLLKGSKYISNDSSVGLVTYSDDVEINLPIAKFDLNQRALFTGAVEDIKAIGGTATNNAVLVAADMLLKAKENNPNAKLMLFVLSDGEQNKGYSLDKITGVVEGLKVPIYTIGYNANVKALSALSDINEAASINADSDDVVYKLGNLFNAQM
ncbi:von Willebrand factor type A domain protein [compost metagenome]